MKLKSSLEGYFFVLPPLIVLFALIGYPVIYNIYLSFFESGYGVHKFIGWENYVKAFTAPGFGTIALNTLIWTVVNMAIMLILGMTAALSLNRDLRGKTGIQVLLLIPWVVPFVVTGVTWSFLFHPRWGAINDVLIRLKLISQRILWLEKPNTSLASVMI
ncbi:MAG: sugar ABC transporter permease, partial [Methanothrix sp.]|nr:sugar ABC transporter permease [Methanothrix sp.]